MEIPLRVSASVCPVSLIPEVPNFTCHNSSGATFLWLRKYQQMLDCQYRWKTMRMLRRSQSYGSADPRSGKSEISYLCWWKKVSERGSCSMGRSIEGKVARRESLAI